MTLEQELVRAEAQSLVAEAQLTNVTRQKFKNAYDLHTAAIIERAEKQIMLAQHARRLLNLLDDAPIVPGEERQVFSESEAARDVLNDAEESLRSWRPSVDEVRSQAGGLGVGGMPGGGAAAAMGGGQSLTDRTMSPQESVASSTEPLGRPTEQQRVDALHREQQEAGERAAAGQGPPYSTADERAEERSIS